MATPAARARQRIEAISRLTDLTNEMAESRGIDPPSIPTSHRDPAYIPTLQIEAVCDFLEAYLADDEPEPEPEPKAKAKK